MKLRFCLYRNHTQSGASASAVVGRYWLITNGNGRETEVQGEEWLASSHLSRLAKSTSTPAVNH